MAILTAFLNTLVVMICLFLICLILIQRGKGGGLAGAFGGMGGSSAFGTKAGDVFTRVTVIVAAVWILLSMVLVVLYNRGVESGWGADTRPANSSEVLPRKAPATGTSGAPGSSTTPAAPASGAPASTEPSSTSIPAIPAPAGSTPPAPVPK